MYVKASISPRLLSLKALHSEPWVHYPAYIQQGYCMKAVKFTALNTAPIAARNPTTWGRTRLTSSKSSGDHSGSSVCTEMSGLAFSFVVSRED